MKQKSGKPKEMFFGKFAFFPPQSLGKVLKMPFMSNFDIKMQ
jgi:hypothetical protein